MPSTPPPPDRPESRVTRVVSAEGVGEAIAVLRSGGLVALPTETVYGLAARADDAEAVAAIFRAKGRPADNPLIVHLANADDAFALGREVPVWARELGATVWPGPLTLVLRSAVDWPWVQAGHDTIAVRVPATGLLREVIEAVGPLAAPSANRSGRPSPTTAAHCLVDLDGRVELIVDGGPSAEGLESTVVDATGPLPVVLRPGPVSEVEIDRIAGGLAGGSDAASPGTRHPHYRPRAEVVLVEPGSEVRGSAGMWIAPAGGAPPADADHEEATGGAGGGATYPGGGRLSGDAGAVGSPQVILREWRDLAELARHLYAWLREADALGVSRVYVVRVPEEGLGATIMNRLERAAGAR